MLILIENGEVYTPGPIGRQSILIDHETIIKIGEVDRRGLDLLKVEYEVINASGCYVIPGLIDPHEHLLGGSGEGSLSLQSPMLFLTELLTCGITSVVGVLGTDTTMKTIAGLLARVKGLKEEGLTTRMWSGGYNVPPTTVLDSIREDMMFIDEVVGYGELAISDQRSLQVSIEGLAKLVLDTHVGGLLSGKAGITHFHVGESERRLAPLRELIERFEIKPGWLYPTHCGRNEKLLDEAIELSKQGAYIDIDTTDGKLGKWLRRYFERGGDPARVTISSDSGLYSPRNFFAQFRACLVEEEFTLAQLLPCFTANTAAVLKLDITGQLSESRNGDAVVIGCRDFEIREVISRGKRMIKDGRLAVRERFLEKSDREIHLSARDD